MFYVVVGAIILMEVFSISLVIYSVMTRSSYGRFDDKE